MAPGFGATRAGSFRSIPHDRTQVALLLRPHPPARYGRGFAL